MEIFFPLPILEHDLLDEFTEMSGEEAAVIEETEGTTEVSVTVDNTEDVATFPFSLKLFQTEAIDNVLRVGFKFRKTAWKPDMIWK